jgi:hypothetical protein
VAEAREHLRAGDLERARRALALADPAEAGFRAMRAALQAGRRGHGTVDRQPEETRAGLIGVLGWSPSPLAGKSCAGWQRLQAPDPRLQELLFLKPGVWSLEPRQPRWLRLCRVRGGSVSPLQALAVPGAGALHITGNVGASGQEAARVAWTCLKARAAELGVAREVVQQDLHLHYADTAVEADGRDGAALRALAKRADVLRGPIARAAERWSRGARPASAVNDEPVVVVRVRR